MNTAEELAEAWLAQPTEGGEPILYDECEDAPELAWSAILHILKHELSAEQTALLAAGRLEDLLSKHGPQFIERVERQASDPQFNYLLGGVWRLGMTEDVWARVQAARKEVW